MTLDPTIREQTYQYFLQEAPELLQAIEQGLLSLKENWGINQVNNLMRATHTLKGAATSVELETVATVAHSLEDIFKALCQPDVSIDPEVEALLFEGFECLRLPLVAELTGGSVNHAEILDRAAAIFARLQEKLGDFFGREAHLPTSAELGFDLTQSLFEVGVTQRLEQIATALENGQSDEEIASLLRTQAEVFLGLAESLNLSGFRAIAQAVLAALDNHPDRAVFIAQIALRDLQAGQTAVLAGDRSQGGEPSSELQQLADFTTSADAPTFLTQTEVNESLAQEPDVPVLESIWVQQVTPVESILEQHLGEFTQSDSGARVEQDFSPSYNSPQSQPSVSPLNPLPQKDQVSPSPTVRVSVKHLDRLNYSVGELVTNQNSQSLQIEKLQATSKTLLRQIKQHQKLLTQLQDQSNRQASLQRRSQTSSKSSNKAARKASKALRHNPSGFWAKDYGNNAHLIQSLLDHMVQLAETAEAIDLLAHQSNQTVEKQQQLLSATQSTLIEARMLPLGEIFGRFPHILQQLETLYNKPISLELHGNEVLVDKAVAEKLFDPLLHLVRNAFDHGIEPAVVRQQRGKAQKGQIKISAYHQGRYLAIEVQDDGNGLDFEQIRQRAVEGQLVSLEQANSLNQTQLSDLLFEPGFSTASQVNDLSGRGIGLDVVRNQLKSLRGSVTVDSQLHQGTTFTLQIPLSLTIAQLFVCQVGSKTYALLDDAVEQILMPLSSQILERNGSKFLRWSQGGDEKLLPIYSLTRTLDYNPPTPPVSDAPWRVSTSSPLSLLLIRCQDGLFGLEVDQLIGEQELVIRPLGAAIAAPSYVHGASILADGQLALVIDGATLIQKMYAQQYENTSSVIWAESVPSMLPQRSQQLLLSQSHGIIPALPASEFGAKAGARILIVDDSITTRQSLALILQKAGYSVFQAEDGNKGLELFQNQIGIQLVICDIEMPRMNGFEFLRSRQRIPALADIPILVLSSQSSNKHRLLASQLGATVYMTKPYMEHKLLTMVANLLEKTTRDSVSQ
jgi:chemotaxis protein histidine kinase CheA/ActR/RegA family two-component response regulator